MQRLSPKSIFVCALLTLPLAAKAQLDPLRHHTESGNPVTQPTLSPGVIELMKLDAQFSDETVKGGGRVFSNWFADDALALNNGKQPTYGKANIANAANWDAKDYQLKWQPLGAQMGPSGDMGFTWGHYEGRSKDNNGNDIATSGRYITVWKKVNGKWKVALDASANEPAEAGDCCKLPNP